LSICLLPAVASHIPWTALASQRRRPSLPLQASNPHASSSHTSSSHGFCILRRDHQAPYSTSRAPSLTSKFCLKSTPQAPRRLKPCNTSSLARLKPCNLFY
ncbi:hypothetical protein DFH06DRAFT_1243331, partial [Mycena polygramma]